MMNQQEYSDMYTWSKEDLIAKCIALEFQRDALFQLLKDKGVDLKEFWSLAIHASEVLEQMGKDGKWS